MKKIILLALVIMAGASFNPLSAGDKNKKKKTKASQSVVLTTPADSISYAAGNSATQGLMEFLKQNFNVDESQMDEFVRGYEEAVARHNDPRLNAYSAGVQVAQMAVSRMIPGIGGEVKAATDTIDTALFHRGFIASLQKDTTVMNARTAKEVMTEARNAHRKAGERFLAENAKKAGVVVTPSGLQYKVLRKGNGPVPKENDRVVVKYEGKLIDGTVFDSSYKRNPQTNEFTPKQVIKGWTEALTLMPVGSKWEIYIPQELAYGSRPAGKIPPYSALIFTVELEEIK